jgi:hypothetical protein
MTMAAARRAAAVVQAVLAMAIPAVLAMAIPAVLALLVAQLNMKDKYTI